MVLRRLVLAERDAIPQDDAAGAVPAVWQELVPARVQRLPVVLRHVRQRHVLGNHVHAEQLHLQIEEGDHALRRLADVELLRPQKHQLELRVFHVARRDEQREVEGALRTDLHELGIQFLHSALDEGRAFGGGADHRPVDLVVDCLALLQRELLQIAHHLQLALRHFALGFLRRASLVVGGARRLPLLRRRHAAVGAEGGVGRLGVLRGQRLLAREHGREGAAGIVALPAAAAAATAAATGASAAAADAHADAVGQRTLPTRVEVVVVRRQVPLLQLVVRRHLRVHLVIVLVILGRRGVLVGGR
mmetsp:Transcript_14041/g.40022  ORF Transcript_14041/g.40022 Transcript_14041/m.40022 type:complete len:304 (+) Transcript_14041:1070-1981(+)